MHANACVIVDELKQQRGLGPRSSTLAASTDLSIDRPVAASVLLLLLLGGGAPRHNATLASALS